MSNVKQIITYTILYSNDNQDFGPVGNDRVKGNGGNHFWIQFLEDYTQVKYTDNKDTFFRSVMACPQYSHPDWAVFGYGINQYISGYADSATSREPSVALSRINAPSEKLYYGEVADWAMLNVNTNGFRFDHGNKKLNAAYADGHAAATGRDPECPELSPDKPFTWPSTVLYPVIGQNKW